KAPQEGGDGVYANAPPKVLRKDHAAFCPTQSTIGEKSTRVETGSTLSTPTPYANRPYQSRSSKGATVTGDPDSEKSTSFTSLTGSPSGIYQPGWGVTNSCRLESPDVCQDVVAMGSQLRLRFEQEARLLKRATEKGLRNQTKNLEALLEAEVDMKKAMEAENVELAKERGENKGRLRRIQEV
ncbi:hypothetical protein Tco_0107611, partial [Tanacetum coccineum]